MWGGNGKQRKEEGSLQEQNTTGSEIQTSLGVIRGSDEFMVYAASGSSGGDFVALNDGTGRRDNVPHDHVT